MQKIRCDCCLRARGFNCCPLTIISSLKIKIKYIMPQQSNEKLKRLIESSKLSAYTIFEYVFNEDRAEEDRFGAKLFYIIAENGEKYTFVTNIDADDETMLKLIVQCYDKRWDIETGYRTESKFWCKTTSKSFNIRTFLRYYRFFCKTFGHLKIICRIKRLEPMNREL